ncbi:MAG: thiol-disulfide oxidoreductase DCC family protein [Mycobacterium sp.]
MRDGQSQPQPAGRSDDSTGATAPVLLYDGVCGFCNSAVQTILRLDRHGTLQFAALQSDVARGVIARHPYLADVDSVVFVDSVDQPGERVSIRSAAALQVAAYLGGPWRALLVAGLIPEAARDWLYDGFAGVRYRIFGTHDTCPIPAPEVRARFLD